jgi:hypothetical protein
MAVPAAPRVVMAGDGLNAGVVEITGTPAEVTLMFNCWLTVPAAVGADMVGVYRPDVVGVPLSCPVVALRLIPGGSEPLVTV